MAGGAGSEPLGVSPGGPEDDPSDREAGQPEAGARDPDHEAGARDPDREAGAHDPPAEAGVHIPDTDAARVLTEHHGHPPVVLPPSEARRRFRKSIIKHLIFLALAGLGLYIVWPSLMDVFASWPRLYEIKPIWYVGMAAAIAGSISCVWVLYGLVLHSHNWFAIITAQLASSAFGRIVPGGAATAGAFQYQMLTRAGVRGTRVATGITVVSIISAATSLALPLFAFPALFSRLEQGGPLVRAGLFGLSVLAVVAVFSAFMLIFDHPLVWLGRLLDRISDLVRRKHPRTTEYGARLLNERDVVRTMLGRSWWKAVLAALGQRGLDFAALVMALYASGAHVSPLMALLAYAVAQILLVVPITPGGLGLVEVGLVGSLGLAGVEPSAALVTTLVYRLIGFWFTLPAGLIAYVLFAHRYERSRTASIAE